MEKVVWTGFVYPGKIEEYRKRHDEIWPEMRKALYRAGVRNYSIFSNGERLIGYYECDSKEFTEARKRAEPIMKKWQDFMRDIMELETNQGEPPFEKVFSLEEAKTEEQTEKGEGKV